MAAGRPTRLSGSSIRSSRDSTGAPPMRRRSASPGGSATARRQAASSCGAEGGDLGLAVLGASEGAQRRGLGRLPGGAGQQAAPRVGEAQALRDVQIALPERPAGRLEHGEDAGAVVDDRRVGVPRGLGLRHGGAKRRRCGRWGPRRRSCASRRPALPERRAPRGWARGSAPRRSARVRTAGRTAGGSRRQWSQSGAEAAVVRGTRQPLDALDGLADRLGRDPLDELGPRGGLFQLGRGLGCDHAGGPRGEERGGVEIAHGAQGAGVVAAPRVAHALLDELVEEIERVVGCARASARDDVEGDVFEGVERRGQRRRAPRLGQARPAPSGTSAGRWARGKGSPPRARPARSRAHSRMRDRAHGWRPCARGGA